MDNIIIWPPPYTLKKHPRARHVKLKTSLHHGLELVVPLRFNEKHITEILETNKIWIIKKLAEFNEKAKLNANQPNLLPDKINLFAINQVWPVQYIKSDNKKIKLHVRPEKELVLFGNIDDQTLCKKILAKWVKQQANIYLPICIDTLSKKTRLHYQDLTIRSQRARWGSCTNKKSISLNYKLLFLPQHLMEHILIHELCHTAHLNHSTKFWRLVASFDPNWKQHSREARRAEVPSWIN